MLRAFQHLRRALWSAFGHSAFSMAKAAAYSAMLSIFPALVVVTTLIAVMPSSDDVRGVLRGALQQVLPPDTMLLVQNYFINYHTRSVRIVWGCAFVSLFAAMGVLMSLMEGFRRAYRLPRGVWGFWQERIAATLLVPGTMVPMATATVFLTFGHFIEQWMIANSGHELRLSIILFWRLVRWGIALLASVMSLALIYHFGLPRHKHPERGGSRAFIRGRWRETLPGAAIATASWFIATLIYGWYVTRFADYSIVYGSLGAAIATLVWLYMISLSVLIGAEFNAQLYPFPDIRPVPISNDEFAGDPSFLPKNPPPNPPIVPPHAARSAAAR
ncbi:MAG TPA: YihY/virulence factor BrkB family protein [Acidobacteriaceae bacterium]|jgi:membrane protein|nr:YihY/virulence factor BrkB family protein [Acidobacteriaceae bacterium]